MGKSEDREVRKELSAGVRQAVAAQPGWWPEREK